MSIEDTVNDEGHAVDDEFIAGLDAFFDENEEVSSEAAEVVDDIEVDDDEMPGAEKTVEKEPSTEEVVKDGDEGEENPFKQAADDITKEGETPEEVVETDEGYEALTKEIKDLYEDPRPGLKFASLKKEVKDLKTKLTEYETNTPETEEVVSLRAKAASLEEAQAALTKANERLALVDYESTPEYEKLIVQPYNEVQRLAEIIEKANNMDEGAVIKAIANPDRAVQDSMLDELEGNLSARDMSRVNMLADKFLILQEKTHTLRAEAADRLSSHREQQTTLQAEQAERARAQYSKGVDKVFDRYSGKLPGFVDDTGSSTESYAELKQAAASMDFDAMDSDKKAYAAFSVAALPELVSQIKSMQGELANLRSVNSSLTKVKPSTGGQTVPSTKAKKTADPEGYFSEESYEDLRFRSLR